MEIQKVEVQKNEEQRTVVDHSMMELREHGTAQFPIGIYRDDLALFENGQIRWHWHEQLQLNVVEKGRIVFQVGSRELVLSPGQGIFINTGVLHRMYPFEHAEEGEKASEMAWKSSMQLERENSVIYSFVFLPRLLEADPLSMVYQECMLPVLKGTMDAVLLGEEAIQLLHKSAKAYKEKLLGYGMEIKSCLCTLWNFLLTKSAHQEITVSAKEQRDVQRVKEALTFIEEKYGDPISLAEISDSAALSKSELCRCFKRVLKMSPAEYLIQFRVGKAAKLLRETDFTITDIAVQTGFDSASHLGRFFGRYCGCAPSAYRKEKQ